MQSKTENRKMKKKMIVILAGALLAIGMTGNAFASFTNDDLIRVVYQTAGGTAETATDLGSISSLLGVSNDVVGGGAGAFTANGISSANLANYNVAYFVISNDSGTKQVWVSGDPATATKNLSSGWSTTLAGLENIEGTYAGLTAVSGTVASDTTAPANSYFKVADGSGTKPGAMVGIVASASRANTEASLATLTTASPVTQGLWYFATAGTASQTGTLALNLQTNADGSTTINASSTPIPPSFFLMGSGLLGMVGLRRKKRA
jgi:hypothetical protein